MQQSIAFVAVLMTAIGVLQAQKPLTDYRMWSKPEVLWMLVDNPLMRVLQQEK